MEKSFQILNVEALKNAPLYNTPFPYIVVDNLLRPEVMARVVDAFPMIGKRGSFPLNDVMCRGEFATLMEELQCDEFRALIGERFGMDLQNHPPFITLRGYTTHRDGHIHTDSASKLITVLLYLNPGWQDAGGRLRLLYNEKELTPYVAEIPPEAGRCVLFKVTPNCWHGHEPFVGVRRSIQLNYVQSDGVKELQRKRHRWSALLKRVFVK